MINRPLIITLILGCILLLASAQSGQAEPEPTDENVMPYRSVFFVEKNRKKLNFVIHNARAKMRGEDYVFDEENPPIDDDFFAQDGMEEETGNTNHNQPVAQTHFTYPQFSLDSILYRRTNDWAVWINGTKVTSAQPDVIDNLEIVRVDARQVQLLFTPPKNAFITFKNQSVDDRIRPDPSNNKITIFLRPNQTFGSYAMTIFEGKVTPVTIAIARQHNAPHEDIVDRLEQEMRP